MEVQIGCQGDLIEDMRRGRNEQCRLQVSEKEHSLTCKGPEVTVCLAGLKNSKEANVAEQRD